MDSEFTLKQLESLEEDFTKILNERKKCNELYLKAQESHLVFVSWKNKVREIEGLLDSLIEKYKI